MHKARVAADLYMLSITAGDMDQSSARMSAQTQSPAVMVHMPLGLAAVPLPKVAVVLCRPT